MQHILSINFAVCKSFTQRYMYMYVSELDTLQQLLLMAVMCSSVKLGFLLHLSITHVFNNHDVTL